jgi:hypothetical protein
VVPDVDHLYVKRIHLVSFAYIVIEDITQKHALRASLEKSLKQGPKRAFWGDPKKIGADIDGTL